jgi:hypothetical protein
MGGIQESFQQSLVEIGSVVSEEKIFLTLANQKKRINLGGHVCRPNGTKWRNFIEDFT